MSLIIGSLMFDDDGTVSGTQLESLEAGEEL